MGCERIEELLSPYLEDELTQEQKQTVETHIHTCPSCAELLSLMREAKESLSFFPEVNVSETLIEKLYELPHKRKKCLSKLKFARDKYKVKTFHRLKF